MPSPQPGRVFSGGCLQVVSLCPSSAVRIYRAACVRRPLPRSPRAPVCEVCCRSVLARLSARFPVAASPGCEVRCRGAPGSPVCERGCHSCRGSLRGGGWCRPRASRIGSLVPALRCAGRPFAGALYSHVLVRSLPHSLPPLREPACSPRLFKTLLTRGRKNSH